MWYTKRQYESAIQEKERKIDEILDSFRDVIIEQLEAIAKSEGYKEKYELLLRNKGYGESIKRDIQTKNWQSDEVYKKYDLCFLGQGYGKSKSWYLLDRIEYDSKLRFYIDAYWSLPPDYSECDCKDIPSKVLWSALKEFKKHITLPVREAQDGDITIDEIMLFLRKEGFSPQKQDDMYISFKFQGDTLEIAYAEHCFEVFFRGLVAEEEIIPALEKAAFKIMQEGWFLKIFLDKSDNLIFSVQFYIETISEMERLFPLMLRQLTAGVHKFQETFNQIWLDMQNKE